MIFIPSKLSGAFVIHLEKRCDARGFFARSWCAREFAERGLKAEVAQVNVAYSRRRGTLRGLHFQLSPRAEAKVIRCTRGAIYDVIVDLRPSSPTYCQWLAVELTADNHQMLYAPPGVAHGYQTLCDDTEITYLTSEFYAPDFARGVRYDDPLFRITWPVPVTAISDADQSWPPYQPVRPLAQFQGEEAEP